MCMCSTSHHFHKEKFEGHENKFVREAWTMLMDALECGAGQKGSVETSEKGV